MKPRNQENRTLIRNRYGRINAIGRRKAAVARVYLNDGKGKITVNAGTIKNILGRKYWPMSSPALKYLQQWINLILSQILREVVLKAG